MSSAKTRRLGLRVGDIVEVCSEQEILATLDDTGAIDGMPFMPEMLAFCGQRFRVEKRADKTCNTITVMESRRLYDAVHLEGLRCDGAAHGGCQAQCFLFWKEAWLKRVEDRDAGAFTARPEKRSRVDLARLSELTVRPDPPDTTEPFYRCQVTELVRASKPLPWWDVRQYFRDVISGNISVMELVRTVLFRIFQRTLRITAYRAQIKIFNRIQAWRGGTHYPYLWGTLDKTPRETLDLQPGELVQVKSHEEILATLNKRNRNRGLFFDAEMVPYCGTTRRVRARVEKIIEEGTGRMMKLPGECVILEGAVCQATYSQRRLFCPRNIFPFWREIWLKRVPGSTVGSATDKPSPSS